MTAKTEQIMPVFTKLEATEFFSDFYRGEHHIPSEVKSWGQGWFIFTAEPLSSVDWSNLTRLVLMAHDRAIRVEIRPHNAGNYKICIWKRSRNGNFSESHPSIDDAINRIFQKEQDWMQKNSSSQSKGVMELSDVNNVLEEIRKHDDLRKFQSEKSIELVQQYGISHMQVNFLISVVAAERIK